MLQEIKGKVKNGTEKVTDFCKDHWFELAVGAGCIVGGTIGIVLVKRDSKKFETMWRGALHAYRNGDLNYDYGPYKVVKFFDPKTLEQIGDTVMHKDTVEAFMNCK